MKKILLTAGIANTDRPERFDFVLRLWESLVGTFCDLGLSTKLLYHPCLTPVGFFAMAANMDTTRKVMDSWGPDFVLLWNGNSDGDLLVLEDAKARGIVPLYAELGHFPQRLHLHFDIRGVNAASSLSRETHPKLLPLEKQELARFRETFSEGKPAPTKEHHLIALQDEGDSNILNSRFDSMFEFVEDALQSIGKTDLPILVRKHPHHPGVNLQGLEGFEYDTGDLYDSIMGAKCVHAVNSTVLLEAAMLGKHIQAYGRGLIHPSIRNIDGLLYQLICRQLHWEDLADAEKMRNYPAFAEAGLFD